MNDYFASNLLSAKGKNFVVSLLFSRDKQWDQQEHPYGLSYRGKFLGVWISNFSIFWSMQRSPTRE